MLQIGEWKKTLPKEVQKELISLRKKNHFWNIIGPAYIALWVISAFVIYQNPENEIIKWILAAFIGTLIHSLSVLMHEACHYSITGNKIIDRWLGFIYSLPVFMSGSAYRATHKKHHRATRQADDPDEFTNITSNKKVLNILFYLWPFFGTLGFFIHVPAMAFKWGSKEDKRQVIEEYILMAILFAFIIPLSINNFGFSFLVDIWIKPLIFTILIANLRGWAEHSLTDKNSKINSSRTIPTYKLLEILFCNINYHQEHHIFSQIPWYNLPKAHQILKPHLEEQGAVFFNSYLEFFINAIKTGANGSLVKS